MATTDSGPAPTSGADQDAKDNEDRKRRAQAEQEKKLRERMKRGLRGILPKGIKPTPAGLAKIARFGGPALAVGVPLIQNIAAVKRQQQDAEFADKWDAEQAEIDRMTPIWRAAGAKKREEAAKALEAKRRQVLQAERRSDRNAEANAQLEGLTAKLGLGGKMDPVRTASIRAGETDPQNLQERVVQFAGDTTEAGLRSQIAREAQAAAAAPANSLPTGRGGIVGEEGSLKGKATFIDGNTAYTTSPDGTIEVQDMDALSNRNLFNSEAELRGVNVQHQRALMERLKDPSLTDADRRRIVEFSNAHAASTEAGIQGLRQNIADREAEALKRRTHEADLKDAANRATAADVTGENLNQRVSLRDVLDDDRIPADVSITVAEMLQNSGDLIGGQNTGATTGNFLRLLGLNQRTEKDAATTNQKQQKVDINIEDKTRDFLASNAEQPEKSAYVRDNLFTNALAEYRDRGASAAVTTADDDRIMNYLVAPVMAELSGVIEYDPQTRKAREGGPIDHLFNRGERGPLDYLGSFNDSDFVNNINKPEKYIERPDGKLGVPDSEGDFHHIAMIEDVPPQIMEYIRYRKQFAKRKRVKPSDLAGLRGELVTPTPLLQGQQGLRSLQRALQRGGGTSPPWMEDAAGRIYQLLPNGQRSYADGGYEDGI